MFYNEEYKILYTIQPSRVAFTGVFECQVRKSFVREKMSYDSKNIRAVTDIF